MTICSKIFPEIESLSNTLGPTSIPLKKKNHKNKLAKKGKNPGNFFASFQSLGSHSPSAKYEISC